MKTIFLCFLILTVQLLSQGWNNIVTTTINEPNCERIDLFTNKDGNHIVIQNVNSSNSIKYYLLNSSGTVVRSATIETSNGAQFPNISGDNDKVYLVYKLGSNLIAKKSTDAGTSWSTNITPLPIGSNTCNGVDIQYDSRGLHVVYATQDDDRNFETYYYKLNSSNNWVDYICVTEGEEEYGGIPRIALSSNKVHVVYNTGEGLNESSSTGVIKSRDKNLVNNNWEETLLAFEPATGLYAYNQQVIIDENNVEWCFTLLVFPPPQTGNVWIALNRDLDGSWNEIDEFPPTGSSYVHQLTFSSTQNNEGKIFTFYSVYAGSSLVVYKTIIEDGNIVDTSSSNLIYPLTLQLKSASVSNDVYLVWRNEGSNYLSYQQYDEVPFAPQDLDVTVSSSNHPLLTWTKNNEPDINYYTIERSGDGEYYWETIGQTSNTYYEDQTVSYCTSQWCSGTYLWYRIKAVDLYPKVSPPSDAMITIIDENSLSKNSGNGKHQIPLEYSLDQNYPNPFNPTTKISYGLPNEGLVTIKIYDVLGNVVAVLVNEVKPEGNYEVEFNAGNLPSGIYFYKMQSGKFTAIKKMLLIR